MGVRKIRGPKEGTPTVYGAKKRTSGTWRKSITRRKLEGQVGDYIRDQEEPLLKRACDLLLPFRVTACLSMHSFSQFA